MSRDEMSALQGKRLNKLVNLVYHNVPFYRNKMQEMDLSPDDIQTIEDIVKLPFTTKQDLRDNYPYGLQAAPASEIVRVHASSGTTGNPTIVGYTRRDLSVWSDVFIIVMESFSRLVMKTGATPNLCRLADEGVMFENFYANSFRTDRGLVAVLSGFPAQPSMSIMECIRVFHDKLASS